MHSLTVFISLLMLEAANTVRHRSKIRSKDYEVSPQSTSISVSTDTNSTILFNYSNSTNSTITQGDKSNLSGAKQSSASGRFKSPETNSILARRAIEATKKPTGRRRKFTRTPKTTTRKVTEENQHFDSEETHHPQEGTQSFDMEHMDTDDLDSFDIDEHDRSEPEETQTKIKPTSTRSAKSTSTVPSRTTRKRKVQRTTEEYEETEADDPEMTITEKTTTSKVPATHTRKRTQSSPKTSPTTKEHHETSSIEITDDFDDSEQELVVSTSTTAKPKPQWRIHRTKGYFRRTRWRKIRTTTLRTTQTTESTFLPSEEEEDPEIHHDDIITTKSTQRSTRNTVQTRKTSAIRRGRTTTSTQSTRQEDLDDYESLDTESIPPPSQTTELVDETTTKTMSTTSTKPTSTVEETTKRSKWTIPRFDRVRNQKTKQKPTSVVTESSTSTSSPESTKKPDKIEKLPPARSHYVDSSGKINALDTDRSSTISSTAKASESSSQSSTKSATMCDVCFPQLCPAKECYCGVYLDSCQCCLLCHKCPGEECQPFSDDKCGLDTECKRFSQTDNKELSHDMDPDKYYCLQKTKPTVP